MTQILALSRIEKAQRTQWSAQFLVAAELVRRGYTVSFTMGNHTPQADLMVGRLSSSVQFWVDVKGLSSNSPWLIKPKAPLKNLFYVLTRVGALREEDRFFVLSQSETNKLIGVNHAAHPADQTNGFGWKAPHKYEGKWDRLPR